MDSRLRHFSPGSLDTHVHCRFSFDSQADPREELEQARRQGLQGLIFTDHLELDPRDEGYMAYDYAGIQAMIQDMRQAFPELAIFHGAEISYRPERECDIRAFLEEHPLDFTLGSVHSLDEFDLSLASTAEIYFSAHEARESYERYFTSMDQLIESHLFDAIGHFDVCKRFGCLAFGEVPTQEIQSRLLTKAFWQGLWVEINTSGLRQAPKEPYPAWDMIRAFPQGLWTLGSDAHVAKNVGYGFEQTVNRRATGT